MEGDKRFWLVALCAVFVLALTGCGIMAQFLYVVKGLRVKAAYGDLREKRVAVICVSEASAYGPDTLSAAIAESLGEILAREVPKISVVPQAEIADWIDRYGWNEANFQAIGLGVKADKMVVVEIDSYSIRDGSTLFKGRADIAIAVYDTAAAPEPEFVHGPVHYEFPRSHGRPAIGTSETQFEALFVRKLVDQIARLFYDHERVDAVAEDATLDE
jgi:hypothetical protein